MGARRAFLAGALSRSTQPKPHPAGCRASDRQSPLPHGPASRCPAAPTRRLPINAHPGKGRSLCPLLPGGKGRKEGGKEGGRHSPFHLGRRHLGGGCCPGAPGDGAASTHGHVPAEGASRSDADGGSAHSKAEVGLPLRAALPSPPRRVPACPPVCPLCHCQSVKCPNKTDCCCPARRAAAGLAGTTHRTQGGSTQQLRACSRLDPAGRQPALSRQTPGLLEGAHPCILLLPFPSGWHQLHAHSHSPCTGPA